MKPQDLVVALAIRLLDRPWTYPILADTTGLAVSQAHASCARLKRVRLLRQDRGEPWAVSSRNLTEFLVHGVRYAFAAKLGETTRGVPTTYAAPFLAEHLADHTTQVWPALHGPARGERLDPLHPSVHHLIAQPGGELVYRRIKQAQGQALWAELGMLGASGLKDDGQARYRTKTLPSKTFTGLAAIVYIHVGTRLYAPQVVDQLGHDFDREWAEASAK